MRCAPSSRARRSGAPRPPPRRCDGPRPRRPGRSSRGRDRCGPASGSGSELEACPRRGRAESAPAPRTRSRVAPRRRLLGVDRHPVVHGRVGRDDQRPCARDGPSVRTVAGSPSRTRPHPRGRGRPGSRAPRRPARPGSAARAPGPGRESQAAPGRERQRGGSIGVRPARRAASASSTSASGTCPEDRRDGRPPIRSGSPAARDRLVKR